VLLYELATGKTPFDPAQLLRAGLDECRRTIREREPARPSTRLATLLAAELTHTANQRHTDPPRLLHQLRGDLDWIVMKCLEKDRTRRYETTNALAADLQRYLEDEPVLARPPSNLYRLRKLLRRHRFAVGATAAVIVTLLAGASISLWQAIRATKAEAQALAGQKREVWLRQQAEEASARARLENAAARLNEYIADINLAQQSIAAGNYGRASQLVEKHRPKPGAPDLRGFEWRYLWRLCRGNEHASLPTQDSSVLSVAFSPDGALAAVGLREQLSIWNLKTGTRLASLPKGAMSLAFLPDGKTLLSASRSAVRRWRTTDWTEIGSWEDSAPIAVSSNGTWLATQARGHVTVWNLETGKEVRSFPGARGPMAFSPEERILATDSRQGVTLWPMKASGEPVVLADSTNLFLGGGPWQMIDRSIAFSPDGQCIVAVRNRPSARGVFVVSIWDAATGQEVGAIPNEPEGPEHTGMIAGLAFSPDGRQLVTASWDHSLRLWDFNTRRLIGAFHGHLNEVWAVAFSPDGRTLLSGAKDGGLCLWPIQPARPEDLLPQGWVPLAFALDSRTLAALHPAKGVVGLINLATHEPEQQFDLELAQPRFGRPGPGPGPGLGAGPGPGPDPGPGRGLGPGSAAGFGGIRSPISGRTNPPGRELKPPGGMGGPMPAFGFLPAIALSANLRVLAQTKSDGTIEFTDTETRETTSLKSTGGRSDIIALSPDARVLIEGKRGEPLRWWELRDRTNALLTLDAHRVLFSPDGRLLAAFQRSNLVELWDVASRSLRTNLLVEPPLGFSVAFSPDGRLLATVADPDDLENAVQLWSTDTANLVGRCVGHKQPVLAVAFAPDGRTLASAGADATIKLWNVATQQELLSVRQSANLPLDLRFSPDGRLLVGTGAFFAPHAPLVVFRAPSPAETEPPRKPRAPQ
jgi:WD40 repeat protein